MKKAKPAWKNYWNSYNDYTDIEYNLAFHQGIYLVDDPALDVTIAQDRVRTACRQQNAYSLCSGGYIPKEK